VLRLVPLYLFAMAVMFAIVGRLSGWTLREPLPRLLKGLATWLGFTFAGAPDLNGVEGTLIIVAGVTWSLVYEWLFYLSLPILGIATRVRPSVPYLLLSLAVALAVGAVMVTTGWKPGIFVVGFFGGGMTAALLVRCARFCAFARNPIASVAVIASLGLLVALYPSAYGYVPVLLLTFAFSLIAAGSSLFGLLTTPMSRVLGDISYSVYLLHGIFLFVLFRGVIGSERASGLQPAAHWTVIALLTPLLVAGCYATYRLVERPAMDSTPRLLGRLRSPVEPPIEEGAGVRPLG